MTTPAGRTINIPAPSTCAELYVGGAKVSVSNPVPVTGGTGGSGGGGAVTVANGADVAQGNTTDAEATGSGSVIAILKRIRTLLGGTLATSRTWTLASGTDSVNVGNFPASQAVSGTVTANTGLTQPLTDTQLRAAAVPVSGTVALSANTPDVTDRAARLLGHVTVDNAAIAVSGALTDTQLRATPLPVSGTVSTGLTQPLTDTQVRATPLPISGTVSTGLTQPLTDAQLRASAVPVSLATNTPDVSDRTARLLGHVTIDNASLTVSNGQTQPVTDAQLRASAVPVSLATNTPVIATGTNSIGTVQQATLTKGTQGATGVSTQDLKDAGRTAVVLSATAVTSIIAETVMSLNQYRSAAATTVTSYTVPAGKTFRLQTVQFGVRPTTPSTTVTFGTARFNLRAGALVTSPLIYGDSKQMQTNIATPNSDLPVPDGLEFPAGTVLSLWQTCSAVTMALDALIVGYEY